MQPEDEITRRRRVTELMAQSLKPPAGPVNTSTQPPAPRISVSAQPGTTITGASGLPQPSPMVSIPSDAPPPNAPIEQPQPRGVFGPSLAGLSKLDRDIALRQATATADPESDVRVRGDQVDIAPPRMAGVNQKGRFRSGLEAGLAAFGNADPDRPLYSLGQGLGGLATGLASPRAGAKLTRRFEQQRLDDDVGRGLKLEQEQAQLGSLEALRRQRELEPAQQAEKLNLEREIQNEKLEIERQKAAGLITKQEADRQQRELDRQSRETIAAENRTSRERIVASRPAGEDTRGAKAAAAQQEYDSLLVEEQAARAEKDRAYKVLDEMRKSGQPKEDVSQAEDAAKAADKAYQSYAEKKRDAQRRVRENQVVQPPSYTGRTMSAANLARYAKDKGISEDEARKQVEAQGVRVQ